MLRTLHEEDREAIVAHEHIERVWATIVSDFKPYFERLVASVQSPTSPEMIAATLGTKFKVKASKHDTGPALAQYWTAAISQYEKRALIYRAFFNVDTLQEYFELDANQFKRDLQKKQNCPIIHDCVMSQREVMHDWQRKFKDRDPKELRGVFRELFNAADDYVHSTPTTVFETANTWEELRLDRFDEDETLRAEGVVGNGIKSTVLYHLNPNYFPLCGRVGLYAFYFMSGMEGPDTPSQTNEFMMVNDTKEATRITSIEHNYWYPYSLYTLYQLRLYRLIKEASAAIGVVCRPSHRFVYTEAFLQHVVDGDRERELLAAMRPVDEELW